MRKIYIHTDFIKLSQLLKWSGIAGTGADANTMILDGIIKVNGETETHRGKKIYSGDLVAIEGADELSVVKEGSAGFVSEGTDADKL